MMSQRSDGYVRYHPPLLGSIVVPRHSGGLSSGDSRARKANMPDYLDYIETIPRVITDLPRLESDWQSNRRSRSGLWRTNVMTSYGWRGGGPWKRDLRRQIVARLRQYTYLRTHHTTHWLFGGLPWKRRPCHFTRKYRQGSVEEKKRVFHSALRSWMIQAIGEPGDLVHPCHGVGENL